MQLLNKTSLVETIDNVNEAFFYGKKISKSDAVDVINWVSTRLNTQYSYRGCLGITLKDMNSRVHAFTGEGLTSILSMRHIMAEEASRILNLLMKITGKKIPALETSDNNLLIGIKKYESKGKQRGTYCCGPCTVGMWRNMLAGGLGAYSKNLTTGIEVLKSFRDDKGRWGRFPFYYTLLVLSEINHHAAYREINYAKPEIERRMKTLKRESKYSSRKYDLSVRLLQI